MFAATYYEERLWIVITGVIARFINGFVYKLIYHRDNLLS